MGRYIGKAGLQQAVHRLKRRMLDSLHEGGIFFWTPATSHFSHPIASLAAVLSFTISTVVVFISIYLARKAAASLSPGW